ncbi:MAG: hypothetical protein AAF628_15350 [Planctomycetota bacterium]
MSASLRPDPKPAPPELLVLAQTEELAAWLLMRTARWPKRVRWTLTQRLENHCLDLLESLTVARYRPAERPRQLEASNLRLERMRRLLRLARAVQACPTGAFEKALRQLDLVGRMMHGWRRRLAGSTTAGGRDA